MKSTTPVSPIELKFCHAVSSKHFMHTDVLTPWANAIEERTGDRIKIIFYPEGTLFNTRETYNAILTGDTDISLSSLGYTPDPFPLTAVLFLPYVSSLPAQVVTRIYHHLYEKFPQMREEYSSIKLLWFMTHGPTGLMSKNKPIRRLEDIQNISVRANGPLASVVKQLGGNPVGMPAPNIYNAMENGTIEAMFVPFEGLISFNLHEQSKYLTIGAAALYGAMCVGMNLDVWNSFPPDIQKIIDEESAKAADLSIKGWDKEDQKGIDFAKSRGQEVIYLSSEEMVRWREKIRPLWYQWVADTEAKKLHGKQVLDETLRLFNKYEKGSSYRSA